LQVRHTDCDVKKLRELNRECSETGVNLVMLLTKDAIKNTADAEDPGEEDIKISKEYFRIPDVVLYVAPSGSLRVMKCGK